MSRGWPAGSASARGSCGGCSASISAPRPWRSRRRAGVLFAKQLIHETDLPMTEVALAAGFGSVRRFNEIFQQLYGRPPARAAPRRRATRRQRGRASR